MEVFFRQYFPSIAVGLVLALFAWLAIRSIVKSKKKGLCAGCSGCASHEEQVSPCGGCPSRDKCGGSCK